MARMIATKPFIFRFADVTVREREFSIEKAGEVQQVQPKAFRVLLVLLRNPNKLITKGELLNTVWRAIRRLRRTRLRGISPCSAAC